VLSLRVSWYWPLRPHDPYSVSSGQISDRSVSQLVFTGVPTAGLGLVHVEKISAPPGTWYHRHVVQGLPCLFMSRMAPASAHATTRNPIVKDTQNIWTSLEGTASRQLIVGFTKSRSGYLEDGG